MRNILQPVTLRRVFLFSFFFSILTVNAQVPQKMSYQAVIRNNTNILITNTTVGMRVSILQNSELGNVIYVETHKPTTNSNGLVSIVIGTGTALTGLFSDIDWATGLYFIKTETDPLGGTTYSITGTSQLMSVPYALYAGNGGTVGPQGPAGAKGDKGDQGVTGAQGLKGDKGDMGTQGLVGPVGPKGDKGDAGIQGVKGDKGDVGAQGLTGAAGTKGDKGEQGTAGPQGLKGDKGDVGAQGLTGPAGVKGDKGDAGIQGPAGTEGPKGDKGDIGIQGIKGDKGDAGAVGPQGLTGPAGAKGDIGLQGIKGDKGDAGTVGPQGLTGPAGAKGDKGDAGIPGVKGDKGDAGTVGPQGLTGPAGAKGDKGDAGIQGLKGDKGDIGLTGPAGPTGLAGAKGDKGDKGDAGADGATNGWALTGNPGTGTANFIGTTDVKPLLFKVNNINTGKIDPVTENLYLGLQTGNYNVSTGQKNTAIGAQIMINATSATQNSAFGHSALNNITTGSSNAAFGINALFSNTSGLQNTAMGENALKTYTVGTGNAAFGSAAGINLPAGGSLNVNTKDNTFIGANADIVAGSGNAINRTAIGANAKVGTDNSLVLGGTGTSAVNVGLGTTSPAAKLHVVGNTDLTMYLDNDGSRLTSLYFKNNGTTKAALLYDNATDDFQSVFLPASTATRATFWTNGLERLRITNTGNVGISTTNPTATLTVNGNVLIGDPATVVLPTGFKLYVETGILTERLKVSIKGTADWADYVFAKEYKLKPLHEVEAFIKKNKHLPNIPSAQELKDTGLDVAQMQAKQMEKIEELTLYIIEMNKKLEHVIAENAALKSSMLSSKNK